MGEQFMKNVLKKRIMYVKFVFISDIDLRKLIYKII